eukprot:m.106123 g.106123  ORF g.106123 m.106123 type:complete len:305 (+) comp21063_c0_seq2:180-1094(+)
MPLIESMADMPSAPPGGTAPVPVALPALSTVAVKVIGAVGIITLARGKHNAWTGRMHTDYRTALRHLEEHAAVRVIVVTGRGQRFCVGADTRALEGHVKRGGYDAGVDETTVPRPGFGVSKHFDADFAYHFGLTKPVIAAVNGAAAGVGLVLACYCDLRFFAETAVMTTAHGKLNLPAEFGLSWLLPRVVGLTRAMEILLTSRRFTAAEALEMGLANYVVADTDLMPRVLEYAAKLAQTVSPGALAATKRQVYLDLHRGVGAAVADADTRLNAMMRDPDYGEGVAAFTQKRLPVWCGRPVSSRL